MCTNNPYDSLCAGAVDTLAHDKEGEMKNDQIGQQGRLQTQAGMGQMSGRNANANVSDYPRHHRDDEVYNDSQAQAVYDGGSQQAYNTTGEQPYGSANAAYGAGNNTTGGSGNARTGYGDNVDAQYSSNAPSTGQRYNADGMQPSAAADSGVGNDMNSAYNGNNPRTTGL